MDRLRAAVQLFKERGKPSVIPRSPGRNNGHSECGPIVYTRTRSLDVPMPTLRRQRVMAAYGKGPYVDAYKILRTQIMQRLRQHDWNVLGVTSPGHGEGKTSVAANLAVSLAMETTQTVLLVDSNLQSPGIHEVFGMGACQGLTDYLLDNEPVEDLLVHPDMGRLVVLPAGRAIPNSAEVLISPKMLALVEEFKHRYPSRVVIFDLPPLLHTADVLAFSPYTDALLLVVEEGKTTVEELQRAMLLVKDRRPVLGTVINKGGRSGLSPAGMRKLLTH